MNLKHYALASFGALGIVVATGCWYVFVAGAPQLDPPVVQTEPGLQFQIATFHSQAMASDRQYGVILPPDYEQHPHQRYPVIVLLHGGHDDARAYADKYAIASVLHQLYNHHALPPAIIITPDGNDNRGSSPLWDPQYFNGPHGQLDRLLGSELVEVVKSRYRTLNEPQFWALGGLSSGGWGAFNIGLRHLDQFHILFSHSGYFTDHSGAANSPQEQIQHLSRSQRQFLRVYLDAGANDTDFVASTQHFAQTLNQLGIRHEFHIFPGGHGLSGADIGWNYFHKHLADSLSYVGQQFQQAGRSL